MLQLDENEALLQLMSFFIVTWAFLKHARTMRLNYTTRFFEWGLALSFWDDAHSPTSPLKVFTNVLNYLMINMVQRQGVDLIRYCHTDAIDANLLNCY